MKYGAGIGKWNNNGPPTERKTRKTMTINKLLHHRSDVAWLHVSKKNGGRGLIAKTKKKHKKNTK